MIGLTTPQPFTLPIQFVQYMGVHMTSSAVNKLLRRPWPDQPDWFHRACVLYFHKLSVYFYFRNIRYICFIPKISIHRTNTNTHNPIGNCFSVPKISVHVKFLKLEYSQTSLIRSSFIRIPRHPVENRWLPIYSICHAYIQYVCSIIRFPRLSGYFVENGCVRLSEV